MFRISPRRWLRFSLRTLLVMVALLGPACGWLAYHVHWIRQRHDLLAQQDELAQARRANVSRFAFCTIPRSSNTADHWLQYLGEADHPELRLVIFRDDASDDDSIERTARLFPEATISVYVETRPHVRVERLHEGTDVPPRKSHSDEQRWAV